MTLHLVSLELGTPHGVLVTPQSLKIADLDSGERGKALIAGLVPALCVYEDMGGLFQISFPAETVVSIRARAPEHEAESRQFKAHYKGNATMDTEIQLERVRSGLQGHHIPPSTVE